MRVSWKWLNELVDIRLKPEELATVMTMAGIPVEEMEYLQKGVEGVRVGLIEAVETHPQADRLLVCRVKIGEGQYLTIVSGAPNLQAGQKVPVAVPGAVLPGNKKIEKTQFRGIDSEGMLCSAGELGLDADKLPPELKDGIYILPPDTPLEADIISLLNLDDIVLELELTPNRSDCLSMINVAREVASLTGGRLKLPIVEESTEGGAASGMIELDIQDPDLCRRYVARFIRDIKLGPSPLWLQNRLLAAGVRPISNIVDVTNYVMLEMGQPLHAFDYDLLEDKKIVVRRARDGEELVTLDGQKRTLHHDMLVIADSQRPVGLAGVMGGLESEVTAHTKNILLESAFFHGPNIRRTSQELGLRSEASQRFEKGVDLEKAHQAADRALQLIQLLGAGTPVPGRVDAFVAPEDRPPIRLRLERVNLILGTALDRETVEKVLVSLQLDLLEKKEGEWLVAPLSYRRDLEKEIDLIEEIARINGYDKIPTTLPYGSTTQGMKTQEQQLRQRISHLMASQGLMDIISYSFINPRHFQWLMLPESHPLRRTVVVKNPLSEEQGVMRTTLVPGLLETMRRNLNRRNKNIRLFELGNVYFSNGFPAERPLPEEKWHLGAAVTGQKEKSWAYGEEEYDFYYLKGVVENLLAALGIEDLVFTAGKDLPWLHPGRAAVLSIKGRVVGSVGEVHPLVLENYGLEQKTTVLELDVEALLAATKTGIHYQPLAKYPAVSRDLAVIVPEKVEAQAVFAVITATGGDWLKQVRLFDLYRGKQVGEDLKSLAFSLTWQAEDRTMTDEEVNARHELIAAKLAAQLGAEIRRF